MEFFFLIGLAVVVLLLLVSLKQKKPSLRLKNEAPSKNLGARPGSMDLAVRLESALDDQLVKKVKDRLQQKDPTLSDHQFDWLFYELKRYFLMSAVLKNVPMFSEKVDQLWHEMLLFTKEYQQFCEAFSGQIIHHMPHEQKQADSDGRAWFDWVYSQLFIVEENSMRIWNGFYRYPLNKEMLLQIESLKAHQIREKYFKQVPLIKEVDESIDYVMNRLRETFEEIRAVKQQGGTFEKYRNLTDWAYLSAPMVFYSVYDYENYQTEMDQLLPNDFQKGGSDSSVCSFDGGGDSGDGGSCSSSCGGGCGS
ncbi:hypothetical protein [Bacillus taeanensis]|uniref:Uncharacterized protein n=1 Tax=Bacillus taeanensis TaxID=273032 RepID=A0A366XW47_9BACI|nr:hypothetical protein [Bacillus taeanensis]RBW68989.1 hypothetical protein DS031_13710 [Bacillus taeanensis]